MNSIKPWRLLRSEIVFDEPWYTLRRDHTMLPDGRRIDDYYVSLRPEVVLVFALTADEEVVMVRQYKHGAGEILNEFPGGTFVLGEEDATTAAARELVEETGYSAPALSFLGTAWDDPTRQNNRIHFFLARGARLTQAQDLDEHEDIEVVLVPLHKIKQLCREGKLCVTGSMALAFLALDAMSRS
jgi:ADP-ribose pyrophosphatase